jgi:hypothetical protein
MKAVAKALEGIYREMCSEGGQSPATHWVTPKLYVELLEEMKTLDQYMLSPPSNRLDDMKLAGIPIKIIPFCDDPLFKQLQSMAALAGAEIRYQTYQQEVLGARFTTNCGGWAYSPAQQCLGGESHLYETDEAGLPLKKPYCFTAAKEQLHV